MSTTNATRVWQEQPLCQHEYVDSYGGWGRSKKDRTILLEWVFCKKCLDKKLIRFDLSQFEQHDDEDDDDNSD